MSSKKAVTPIPDSFEERIERLETIVADLEAGEAPLEESLALFEEGVAIARACQEQIETARQRVELLLEVSGEGVVRTEAMEEEDE